MKFKRIIISWILNFLIWGFHVKLISKFIINVLKYFKVTLQPDEFAASIILFFPHKIILLFLILSNKCIIYDFVWTKELLGLNCLYKKCSILKYKITNCFLKQNLANACKSSITEKSSQTIKTWENYKYKHELC